RRVLAVFGCDSFAVEVGTQNNIAGAGQRRGLGARHGTGAASFVHEQDPGPLVGSSTIEDDEACERITSVSVLDGPSSHLRSGGNGTAEEVHDGEEPTEHHSALSREIAMNHRARMSGRVRRLPTDMIDSRGSRASSGGQSFQAASCISRMATPSRTKHGSL